MDLDPVGALMIWISAYGLIGLFAIASAERFIPIVPSYGVLLAIGIAAAEGAWSLPAAFLATAAGSLFGCGACFLAVRRLGERRSRRVLGRMGRLFGLSAGRIDRCMASYRANQKVLAFSLQLVPTIRLFAPAFAALLQGSARTFLTASAAGIALWNGLFIGVGYVASRSLQTANASVLALSALVCLLLIEAGFFWVARRIRARRMSVDAMCKV